MGRYVISAVNARSGSRIFGTVRACTEKQALFLFKKSHNAWKLYDISVRREGNEQLSIFSA